MDNTLQENELKRAAALRDGSGVVVSGLLYGPPSPGSNEIIGVGGITIEITGKGVPSVRTVSGSSGEFISPGLPPGSYTLTFTDPSRKFLHPPISINLQQDEHVPIFINNYDYDQKKYHPHNQHLGRGLISGFIRNRKASPLKNINVTIKLVGDIKEDGKAEKKKGIISRLLGQKKPIKELSVVVKTGEIGFFATTATPLNHTYTITPSDPENKYRFSSKFVTLKDKPLPPCLFIGYTDGDIDELKKREQLLKQGSLGESQKKQEDENQIKDEKKNIKTLKKTENTIQKEIEEIKTPPPSQPVLTPTTHIQHTPLDLSHSYHQETPPTNSSRSPGVLPQSRAVGRSPSDRGVMGKANSLARRFNSLGGSIQPFSNTLSSIRKVSILSNPYFIVFAIIFAIGLWISLDTGSGSAAPLGGGGGSQGNQSGGGQQPSQSINGALDYYIPFRDSSINPVDLRSEIKQNWPNAKIENWDTIITFARQNGWNPAFLLALWIEESGAQGTKYDDALGCDPQSPTTDINVSLGCVQKTFGSFGNDRFDDLMCRYGGDGFHDAPCVFVDKNPNFPPVIKNWYQKLVPSGPGALVNITPTPLPGYSGTCPIQSGPITCGSNTNIVNNCGHCNPNYGYKDNMNQCTYDEIYYAEDVGATAGTPVFFPTISGEDITWTNIGQASSSIGFMIAYKGTSPSLPPGDTYWLRFHHVEGGSGVSSGRSGQQAAKTCTTSTSCNHLHVEFAVDGTGGRRILDASTSFCK